MIRRKQTITILYNSGNRLVHYFEADTVANIQEVDSNFNQEQFERYTADTFIKVQEAWQNRDINAVRQFESEELYLIHSKQIEEFIERKEIPYIDEQNVLDVHLNNFEIDGKSEYLTVYIEAKLTLYVVGDESNKVVSGSKSKVNNLFYMLGFKRGIGVKTTNNNPLLNCPSCFAPLQIAESGKCEYCDSLVTNGSYSFILDSYERIEDFKKVRPSRQRKDIEKLNK